jgi:hypothetical protein
MRITQVAVVVKDLRATMEKYHGVMGWGPWSVYEHKPPVLRETEVRGKPVRYTMLGAEVHCNPIDFEILQPLEGPSIYKEFLKEKGEGCTTSRWSMRRRTCTRRWPTSRRRASMFS